MIFLTVTISSSKLSLRAIFSQNTARLLFFDDILYYQTLFIKSITWNLSYLVNICYIKVIDIICNGLFLDFSLIYLHLQTLYYAFIFSFSYQIYLVLKN